MSIKKFMAALLIALSFNGCAVRSDKAVKEPVDEAPGLSSTDQKVMSFSLAGYEKNGRKKWEVQGKSADIMSEVVNLTDVVAKAYGEEVDMTLTADKGVFNRNTSDAHFESNVIVSGTDGTKMTTDEADWKNTDQKIVTDKPVKLYAESKDALGGGEGKVPTTIVCDGPMEINYGKNYAVFNTNVRVDDERGQIFCDTATAYYDPGTKKVSRIVAKGNVKIIRGGSWTFSDEAVYFAAEQKIILSGSPKVTVYPEESKAATKEVF